MYSAYFNNYASGKKTNMYPNVPAGATNGISPYVNKANHGQESFMPYEKEPGQFSTQPMGRVVDKSRINQLISGSNNYASEI